jgi:hypothetical protein
MNIKKYCLFTACFLLYAGVVAQGVRGNVYTAGGEPLPFATIYIKALETGSSTNEVGAYEIPLEPGSYELVYQHLGFLSVVRQVEVGSDFTELDVTLPDQAIQLREVEVNADAEDPAYTIMRKAIAKSKYHRLQVQSYTARVYVKGAGRLKDAPFFLEGRLEKEGIDSSTLFLSESVSEITFEQPNTFKEKVISIRKVGEDNQTSPNGFIQGNFYEPEVATAISPLSPRAFSYYRFRFAGSFIERGYEINKIKVIPRRRGDQVFSGFIYIVDDLWSIHSLDMHTYLQGFRIDLRQMYAPIRSSVWLPLSHKIEVGGKVLGFEVEYRYLATVSDYQVVLNPDLQVELEVVDEKIEKELAKALEQEEKLDELLDKQAAEDVFEEKQKFTRRDLKKVLKAYEKEVEKQQEDPEVVEVTEMKIDSTAYENDSTYWAEVRPVPLSRMEVNSYRKLDSMAVAEKKEREEKQAAEASGTSQARNNRGIGSLLFGTTFELSDNTSLEYKSPLSELNFNTVEGYHFSVPLVLRYRQEQKIMAFSLTPRYAFARDKLIGKGRLTYPLGQNRMSVEGGRFISQFNSREPIQPIINTFTTLWYEQNLMKIYEKDYLQIGWDRHFGDKLELDLEVSRERRRPLFNNTTHSWRDLEEETYSPNTPDNLFLENTLFPEHDALLLEFQARLRPFVRYRIRNGKKRLINDNSPEFRLHYRKAIPALKAEVDFDLLELGVRHQWEIGVRGRLDYNLYAGSFLNREQLYFVDYQHFMGNQTVLQMSDPVGSYRLLDYYRFSTSRHYAAGHLYYQFRNFLLTQIFELRMLGLKENLLFNYLKTDRGPHYMEVGYSLDNILRFLRLEAVASFEDGRYRDFGVRLGVATTLEVIFD